MEKKHAFLISFLFAFLIWSNFYLFSYLSQGSNIEDAVIERVIDGDTFLLKDGRTIRLLNINSPEKTDIGSEFSKDYLKSFYNKTIQIEITGIDKYKRNLARIYHDGDYLNLELVKSGFSVKFLVDKMELKKFDDSEREAISNFIGIWKKSEYFGCLNILINEKSEELFMKNLCGEINISGWLIRDESRKKYFFDLVLKREINIHSIMGKDNSTDIFMNFKEDVWNDDRDSLYIFDKKGGLVFHESYGY